MCRRWRRGVDGVVVERFVVEMFVVVVVDPKYPTAKEKRLT